MENSGSDAKASRADVVTKKIAFGSSGTKKLIGAPPVHQEPNGPEQTKDPEEPSPRSAPTQHTFVPSPRLNTSSHSQCNAKLQSKDPLNRRSPSALCRRSWHRLPARALWHSSKTQDPSALGGLSKCSSVGMVGHREGILEMQRLKHMLQSIRPESLHKTKLGRFGFNKPPSFCDTSNLKPLAVPTFPD